MKRFIVSGAVVLDNRLKLQWLQNPGIITEMGFIDALSFCKFLSDGWRLPTIDEFWQLRKEGSYEPLPENHPFSGIFSSYWTSDKGKVFFPNGWYRDGTGIRGVWPVRDKIDTLVQDNLLDMMRQSSKMYARKKFGYVCVPDYSSDYPIMEERDSTRYVSKYAGKDSLYNND